MDVSSICSYSFSHISLELINSRWRIGVLKETTSSLGRIFPRPILHASKEHLWPFLCLHSPVCGDVHWW
ncbi:hypothetical protein RJT34_10754 [Clitoria ternatea]|uniref:Uncharacterized protein n=1 Tax=Clitoria ternatea TaxID=43366 RepID=A0AAN9JIM5_CLITE